MNEWHVCGCHCGHKWQRNFGKVTDQEVHPKRVALKVEMKKTLKNLSINKFMKITLQTSM